MYFSKRPCERIHVPLFYYENTITYYYLGKRYSRYSGYFLKKDFKERLFKKKLLNILFSPII